MTLLSTTEVPPWVFRADATRRRIATVGMLLFVALAIVTAATVLGSTSFRSPRIQPIEDAPGGVTAIGSVRVGEPFELGFSVAPAKPGYRIFLVEARMSTGIPDGVRLVRLVTTTSNLIGMTGWPLGNGRYGKFVVSPFKGTVETDPSHGSGIMELIGIRPGAYHFAFPVVSGFVQTTADAKLIPFTQTIHNGYTGCVGISRAKCVKANEGYFP